MVTIPEEIVHATLETNARKDISRTEEVVYRAKASVFEHRLAEILQPLATGKPSGGNDHCEEAGIKLLGLLNEHLVDRRSTGSVSAVAELVGRVADDDVELHAVSEQLGDASFDVVGVNEGVGVSLKFVATGVVVLGRPAVDAFATGVERDLFARQRIEPDVAVLSRE